MMHLRKELPLIPSNGAQNGGRYIETCIEDPFGVEQRVKVNLGESPLSWLRARGFVSDRLYIAGDRLRQDWEMAGMGPRVTMNWTQPVPASGGRRRAASVSGGPEMRDLAARERFHAALRHSGSGLADILWRVVCAGEGLAAAEKALGWPARAGKLVLGFALEKVADYYRID